MEREDRQERRGHHERAAPQRAAHDVEHGHRDQRTDHADHQDPGQELLVLDDREQEHHADALHLGPGLGLGEVAGLERQVALLVGRAQRSDEELALEQQRHGPPRHQRRRDVDERCVGEGDKDLVGDRIEQAAEHGRAVLAGEQAVDPVGAADHRAGDQRAGHVRVVFVAQLSALVDQPAQQRHGDQPRQRHLVRRDQRPTRHAATVSRSARAGRQPPRRGRAARGAQLTGPG